MLADDVAMIADHHRSVPGNGREELDMVRRKKRASNSVNKKRMRTNYFN